ncbi:MAG: alanyl-tRNA editing protein [Lachnospiraceae bacterium]|nr:alanyl-tRNA editing protein [Lachnospiraceae bacterium]
MKHTEKLYDNDAYATSFSATVLEITPIKISETCSDVYDLVLDKTLFFPEAGGQTSDKGIISPESDSNAIFEVIHTSIENDIIHHTISAHTTSELHPGDIVSGEINFELRYNNMQQHTGEHIFSGIVHKIYGYDNVGFHLSEDIVTMDYNGEFTKHQISELEICANEAIVACHPITCYYPSDKELENIDYRCKKELTGPIRIVHIDDIDDCACCAPHTKNTSEVGLLKIVGYERYKGGSRFTIVCGTRALKDYRVKQKICTNASSVLSVPYTELEEAVSSLLKERNELRQKLHNMNMTEISQTAEKSSKRFLIIDTDDDGAVRNGVNILMEKSDTPCGIFFGNDKDGYRFILGHKNGDARELITRLKESFECRGGGKPQMVQGQVFTSYDDLNKFTDNLS